MSTTVAERTTGAQTLTLAVPSLHARAAEGTEPADPAGREFTGIAVPWDTVIDVWGIREQFAPGSIEPADDVLVCYRHDEPVGIVAGYRDADAGWEIDGALSDTAVARDAATLLRDGVIKKLSIRFEPIEWTETRQDDDTVLLTYQRAKVTEVSLVPFPAYDTAAISSVRHRATTPPSKEPSTMTDTQTTDSTATDELRGAVDELTRRVELIGDAGGREADANPLHQFSSFGEYVKAVAAGDETALRAYNGVVTGDVLLANDDHTWVGDMIRLIEARTPTSNWFTHTKDLPATGMNVDYGILGTNTLRVAEQLAEGDDLVYGKISLADATARVRTLGGWTDMSRQSIERSGRNVVDLAFRGFAIAYANAVEAIAKATLRAVYDARVALAGDSVLTMDSALTTADDVVDLLVDLAIRYENTPYNLDGLWVAPDLFRSLAKIREDKKILQIAGAPTDKVGTLSVSSVEANLSNVTVKLWADAPAGAIMAADRLALKIQESPGAPFKLQDENIVNLTKQFSVYGYLAAYSEMPEGIVPIVVGAGA